MKATHRKRLEGLEAKADKAQSPTTLYADLQQSEDAARPLTSIEKIHRLIMSRRDGTPLPPTYGPKLTIAEITRRVHEMGKCKKPAPDPHGPG